MQHFYRFSWDFFHGPPHFFFRGEDHAYYDLSRITQVAKDEIKKYDLQVYHGCDQPALGNVLPKFKINEYRQIHGDARDLYLVPNYILELGVDHMDTDGVMLPRSAIGCMVETMWLLPIIHLDKLYTAGKLLQACRVRLEQMPDWIGTEFSESRFPVFYKTSEGLTKHAIYRKLEHFKSDDVWSQLKNLAYAFMTFT